MFKALLELLVIFYYIPRWPTICCTVTLK